MRRRHFLKGVGAAATGLMLPATTLPASAGFVAVPIHQEDTISKGTDLEIEAPISAESDDFLEDVRTVAAVFPSEGWGTAAQHILFDHGHLVHVNPNVSNEIPMDIQEKQFAFDAGEAPHVAIALANPHDPESWRAAQIQCAAVKRAGADLTLLFAVHRYPEYQHPLDLGTLTYKPEDDRIEGADLVINFVTANLSEEFPRIAYVIKDLITKQSHICVDLADVLSVLSDAKQALYFRDSAQGSQRAKLATTFACNQIEGSYRGHLRFTGGMVLIEVAEWCHLDEVYEVTDRLREVLPKEVWVLIGLVAGHNVDPWMTVHTIATYEAA